MISRKRLGLPASTLVLAWLAASLLMTRMTYDIAPRIAVHFLILDVATGKPVPAMVCIRDLDDQSVRLPPDGRVLQRVSKTEEFCRGFALEPDNPGWIGPPRTMLGTGDNSGRSYVYDELPSIPSWQEPVRYQVQPSFSIELEPGRYQISVSRGMEYIPVMKEFAVAAQDRHHTLQLERWVDLPARGWFSGDVHVHHPTTQETHRDFLLRYAEAEDLHVVNVLEMGHHQGTDFKQRGFGKNFRQRRGDYWLVSGQEDPRGAYGHIIGLNTSRLTRDLATYDLYDLAFKGLHAQPDSVVGSAHFSWDNLARGFSWSVTTEEIDFVELLQFGRINASDYYDFLNLGFRLAAAAGSDVPWGSTLGEVRTFVYTGARLDLDRWFAGLRAGCTFVSNGPALEFTVNGQLPGSEIEAEGGGSVRVIAQAWGHEEVGLPDVLELVSNDGTLHEVRRGEISSRELTLDVEVDVPRSIWLAVSTRCANGAVAHSSPVYVVVDGLPTWSPKKCPQIVRKQLDAIDVIEKECLRRDDGLGRSVRERLDRARSYYTHLLATVEQSSAE